MAHHWRKWRQACFVLHSLRLKVESCKILRRQAVFFSRQPRNTEICTSQATCSCPPRYRVNWRRLSNWISFSNNRGKSYLNTNSTHIFKGGFQMWNIFHRLTESWLYYNSGGYNWGSLGHSSNVAVYAFISIRLNPCSLKVQIQVWIWGEIFKVRLDEDSGGSGIDFPWRLRRHDPYHHSLSKEPQCCDKNIIKHLSHPSYHDWS